MRVTRAYKTELALNNKQVTACKQHAGAARWAYNWGLARREAEYKANKQSLNAIELHRELNALKKTDLPWLYQVSKCAPKASAAQPGQRLCAFLPPLEAETGRAIPRQARLSHVQEQEEGTGQLPPDWLHCHLP
jgi:putative transposase